MLFFFFLTESVANTLIFTNFNSFVLLDLVLFLWCLRLERPWIAGIAIGLTIAVKPVLLPVLLLALFKSRMWRALIPAIGIPAVLNAVGWKMIVDTDNFMDHTFPYLRETRDYYNSSIPGMGSYYGLPLVEHRTSGDVRGDGGVRPVVPVAVLPQHRRGAVAVRIVGHPPRDVVPGRPPARATTQCCCSHWS